MKHVRIKRFRLKLSLSDKSIIVFSYTLPVMLILLLIGSNFGLPVALSVAVGGSMYPSIRSGNMNILLSTSVSSINPGDIAVYERNGVFVIHRVEKIENNTVIFKGDNNIKPDKPVSIENVKYKVVATIPAPIWVPVLSITLVLSAFTPQIYLRRKYGEGYTIHTLVILALFIMLTSSLSSSVFIDKGYEVKPIPTPKILSVTKIDKKHLLVKFNIDPVSVECKNAQCVKVAPKTVKIVAVSGRSVWIYARLPAVFNTTVVFVIASS